MKALTALLLMATLLPSVSAIAQARPINDGVSNTILIGEREGSYASQGGGRATAELGEPEVGGNPARNTVWYRYVAPASGRYVVEITDTQGLRAELRFPGNPATTIPLQTYGDGTTDTLFPNIEKLSVDLARGQTVYLVVDAAQPFGFSWRFVEVNNDSYRDAETISGASGTVIRPNLGARRSSVEANLGLDWPAVWFEWTAPSTGLFYMDLVGSRQWDGSTFENFGIGVFDNVNGAPVNVIATATGSTLDNSTRVPLNATAGHVYYIACHSGQDLPNSQIWLSWYPQNSAGVLAWAQNQYRTSEADGTVKSRFFKLRGDGDGSVRFISESVSGVTQATPGQDYSIPGDVMNLPVGTRSGVGQFELLPFIEEEGEEAFGVGFTDLTGGLGIQDGTSNTIIIGEKNFAATCGLSQREVHVREGQTAYIELRRQRPSDKQVAVGWRVQSGTCQSGIDMPALSGTAYLAPGQSSTYITVPVYVDKTFEGPESFIVELTDNPQLGAITDGTSNTVVIVEDEDYFVSRPGSYCGLLDTQGWGALIKCTVSGIGGASGTVDYRGATYRFNGSFDGSGQLVANFARNSRPSIGLKLNFAEGWARCAAALRDPEGGWAEGWVRYLPYNAKTSPAPQVGNYTLLCTGIGGASVVAPVVATSLLLGDGSVRFVGRTADNQGFTSSSRISQSDPDGLIAGECAFMIPLYGKTGNLYGTCDFGLGPQQPGAQTILGWLKPWRARDVIYPALPFQTIACQAVFYTPPAAGQRVTTGLNISLGDGSVRFINGASTLDGTSNTLLVSETNTVSFPAGNPQNGAITISPKTGWFSGRITPPGSQKQINFYGVFHQGNYGYGRGFFPGTLRTGEVVLGDF